METSTRAVRWMLLGGWFGSWALFAFAVAPIAFRVLPNAEVAGSLVSPLLQILHLYGVFAGLSLFAIAFASKQRRALRLWPLALAALCAVSEFGVTASITNIRPSTFGVDTPEGAAGQFAQLHLLSRFLFACVLLGSAVLIGLHAREDHRELSQRGD